MRTLRRRATFPSVMASLPEPNPSLAIQALRLDGIPTFVAPLGPMPLRACLIFRVGMADESLSRHGITHLVEHLALEGLGEQPYKYNGMVDGLFTRFYVAGRAGEIVEFLERVVSRLADLPRERLVAEAGVLRTEATRGPTGWLHAMLNYRYGSSGWGLAGLDEFGLCGPDAEEVHAWARTRFTAENAVLWLNGPLPSGLRIRLPSGSRVLANGQPAAVVRLPASAAQSAAGVGVSMTGERSTALGIMSQVARRRAHAQLREGGVGYSVQLSYQPLDKDWAHFALWADALPENVDRVGTDVLKILDGLAETGPRQEELDRSLDEFERSEDEAESVLQWLDTSAANELLGSPLYTAARLKEEIRALTPEGGRQAMAQAMQTLLVMAPSKFKLSPARFTPVPIWSRERLTGVTVGLRLGLSTVGRHIRLTVGDEGVTFALDGSRQVTVWFDRCAAMSQWTDGSRTLYGNDGFRLHICPRDWHDGQQLVRWIDRHVPKEKLVAMGNRPSPDPEVLVREPVYKFATDYFAAATAGLWVLVGMGAYLWPTLEPGAHALTMSLGAWGIYLTYRLFSRLSAPRVRRV